MSIVTCKCGRVGFCSECCCVNENHNRFPDKPCPLCGHVGKVKTNQGQK